VTTLTDRLEYPNVKKVFLLEVTAGERLLLWTLTAAQTDTYEATTSQYVTDLKEDGVSLVEKTSIATVEATAGTWWWDQSAGKVYVHPTGDDDPFGYTMQAVCSFLFSSEPRIYNGRYYDPRIETVPKLSLRVERKFGDVGQIGGGSVVLENNDGYFDDLVSLQWDAGEVIFKIGADNPIGGAEATYGQFDTMGTWNVVLWERKREKFTLKFEEKKGRLKKKIPTTFYNRDDYPSMRESDIGKPRRTAYGVIYDAEPICINEATRIFEVADHAVRGFFGYRIKNEATGQWVDVSPVGSPDLANAQFTLSDVETDHNYWDQHAAVAVDFIGKLNADGTVMDNPADVVKDILTTHLGVAAAEIDD